MKKFTRKLFISIIAVAFAFVALGTSTFAWFSMNTTVEVRGMEIAAKSNNTYLLINTGNKNTPAAIQADGEVEVVFDDLEGAKVMPASPILAANVSDTTITNENKAAQYAANKYFSVGTETVSNATTAAKFENWFTAENFDPRESKNTVKKVLTLTTDDSTDNGYVATTDFSEFVIKKTVYLTLAVGSDNAHNLTVTPTIAAKDTYKKTADTELQQKTYYTKEGNTYTAVETPAAASLGNYYEKVTDISAVKVLVASGNNCVILSSEDNASAANLHETTDTTLTDASVITVDIYIYYDGEAAAVYTNHAADLSAATVALSFGVTIGDGE